MHKGRRGSGSRKVAILCACAYSTPPPCVRVCVHYSSGWLLCVLSFRVTKKKEKKKMGNRTVSTSGGVQQGRTSMEPKNSVSFTLNGAPVNVDGVSPSLTLNSWLRSQPGLTGTKKMCGEGGCGCCVVAVSLQSPDWWPSSARLTEQEVTFAINSVRNYLISCNLSDVCSTS